MTILTGALAALALQAAPAPEPWTWTLYEGDGPMVLANEVPDTPRLRATLECTPGSSAARIAVYGEGADGYAAIASGEAAATTEARSVRGRLETTVRADHPVFAAFQASGELTITVGGLSRAISVDRANLPKLRRFAERCAG